MYDCEQISKLEWEIACLRRQCMLHLISRPGIHPGQQPLLFTLKRLGACNQREIAQALHHSPATVAVSLKRMEKSGLVRRVPDPGDLRSNRIELTADGMRAAKTAENAIRRVCESQFSDFSEAEFSQAMQYFQRVRQNLYRYVRTLEETEEST